MANMSAVPHYASILYATDLSRPSLQALRHALALAGCHEGRVTVLYVTPDMAEELARQTGLNTPGMDDFAEWRDLDAAQRAEAEAALEARVVAFCQEVDACSLTREHVLVKTGRPAAVILELAESGAYDCVVMGAHGQDMITDLLLGSVTSNVVRRSPIPVLSVPIPRE